MYYAPVIILAYNRPEHLKKVLAALEINNLSDKTDVYVFIDGLKSEQDLILRNTCIDLCHQKTSFKSLTCIEQQKNIGILKSVLYSFSYILAKYDRLIYLEDDILPSPYFLEWMDYSLNFYQNHDQIYAINGYSFPVVKNLTTEFSYLAYRFIPWGFGSWKNRIEQVSYNQYCQRLKILNPFYWRRFNYFSYGWGYTYLAETIFPFLSKYIQSWDIQIYDFFLKQSMLTVNPCISYTKNIGLDGTGTHKEIPQLKDKHQLTDLEHQQMCQSIPKLNLNLIDSIQKKLVPLYRKKSFYSFLSLFQKNLKK